MLLVLVLDSLKLGYDAASSQLARSSGPVQISDPTLFILFTVYSIKCELLIILIYVYGNLVTVHYLFGNSMRPSTAFLIHHVYPRIWNSIGKKADIWKILTEYILECKNGIRSKLVARNLGGISVGFIRLTVMSRHITASLSVPKELLAFLSPPSNSR